MPQNIKSVIFSMMTAIAVGGILSLVLIFSFNQYSVGAKSPEYFSSEQISATSSDTIDMSLLEEGEEDSTFVSRFSRVLVYSADNGRGIIENAKKNSFPEANNKKISAKAYMVMDTDRNMMIIEKNTDNLFPLASITKLVTAVVARKLFDQDDSIIITGSVLNTYGNEARFRKGEKFKAKELIYPLLMVSSNDAAEALAQRYGRQKFIEEMNNWANSIGAYRTYFKDPSGLSSQNISTVRDLSIIIKWILNNDPEIFDITLLKEKTIRTHTWVNPTHFLNITAYAGGKNGYTPEADRTSISLFKLGNQKRLYAVALLGSKTRDNDLLDLLDEAVR